MENEQAPYTLAEVRINDMTLAAYLKMRGCRILTAKHLGSTFEFIFERPDNLEQLKVDLANSEVTRFDAAVRDLKRLLYSEKKNKERRR